jgi:hypothetical protein
MAETNRQAIYREAARIRSRQFANEELGSVGRYYKDTAAAYEKKMQDALKAQEEINKLWDDRFKRAEEAYASWKASTKRTIFAPTISLYGDDRPNNKVVDIFKLVDEQGRRRTMEQIEKMGTSKYGYQFRLGEEASQAQLNKMDVDEYTSSFSTYNTRYQEELADLERRNAEARKKFYEDKQRQLAAAESMSAYRGPTYQEKPL